VRIREKIFLRTGYGLINLDKYQPLIGYHLIRLFEKMRVNVVLDVGANDGSYGKTLRKYGYKGHILSFEPLSSAFESLKTSTLKDKKWSAYNIALGSHREEKELSVMRSSDFSSFLEPNSYARLKWVDNVECIKKERVFVERLDEILQDVLPAELSEIRIFLKMDTQGYDLNVFQGALGILKHLVGIQSELSFNAIYSGMPSYIEMLSVFEEHGFKPTGFFPVSKDKENMVIVEADCVFRKI